MTKCWEKQENKKNDGTKWRSNDNKMNGENITGEKPRKLKNERKLGLLIILILLACINAILSVCST